MKYKIIVTPVLFYIITGFAQFKNIETILENVKLQYEKIEDYKVDVHIKVDVSFLKIPDRKATIYYKRPDKIHIDSENFAMLPKSGLNFSPIGFLNYKYTAFYVKDDTINGIVTSVVKVIPLEGNVDIILSSLWIDTQRNLIIKIEASRKPQGSYTINLDYLKTDEGFWLPASMIFSFSVDPSMLPGRFGEGQNSKSAKIKTDSLKPENGKVFLTYSNYAVNIGLPDDFFEKKEGQK